MFLVFEVFVLCNSSQSEEKPCINIFYAWKKQVEYKWINKEKQISKTIMIMIHL